MTLRYDEPPTAMRWLSRMAFGLALVVVMLRALVLETIRDTPLAHDAPAGIRAGAVVILDWISIVPAMLVLLRRVLDKSYTLRFSAAHGLFAAIAGWALLSSTWAGDKYLALVSAGQLLAAAALLWTFSQVVRRWQHLRIVAAVCVGLLAAYAAGGVIYRSIDQPDLEREYEATYATILANQGIEPGSFAQEQFEQRLYSGSLMGYTNSPNVFAALVVMLAIVSIGCVAQRVLESRQAISDAGVKRSDAELGWAAVPGVAAALAPYLLFHTGAKASYLALPAGLIVLAAWWPLRNWLKAHHVFAFSVAGLLVILGGLTLLGTGLYLGYLPQDSLNFRWRYWVGSFGLVTDHLATGVGWSNFANPYLAHRLAAAVEGIKDPHNWVVRLFVELGIVGGLLGLAWVTLLAWAATRPTPADAPPYTPRPTIHIIHLLALPIGALVLYLLLVTAPIVAPGAHFDEGELAKRVLFTGLIALAIGCVPILSRSHPVTDDRPAGWIHASMVVGVGTLVVMSLIDMTLFTTSGLMLVAMIGGAVLGVRLHARPIRPARGTAASMAALVALLLIWLVGLILTVAPVTIADAYADRAQRAALQRRYGEAAELMDKARDALPIRNADYEELVTSYHAMRGAWPAALAAADRAVEADPTSPRIWAQRGRLRTRSNDAALLVLGLDDFRRAIELAPSETDLRLEYADLLATAGRHRAAAEQIEKAIEINRQLDEREPKRFSPQQLDDLQARAGELFRRGG